MASRNIIASNSGLSATSDIDANQISLAYGIVMPSASITQATSTSTGVTINSASGEIVCFTSTQAAQALVTFTVSNSIIAAGDKVLLNVSDYSGVYGTNGFANVVVDNIIGGAFDVKIVNSHPTTAFAGVLKLNFMVVKA